MSNQRTENKKKFSSKNREALECRMYENSWPQVGDVVMVVPTRIEELGAYCNLLEYNNRQGLMLLSELQRRRIRSVKRVIRVGRKEVAIVVKVNKNKEYIDLSRKRVTPEERDAMDIKWNKSKTVHSIMKQVSTLTEYKYSVLDLYNMFGWKMYKKFRHAYDGFKLAMTDKQKFLDIMSDKIKPQFSTENNEEEEDVEEDDVEEDEEDEDKENDDTNNIELTNGNKGIPDDIVDVLFRVVEKRLKAKMVTVRARVEITCFTKYGINGIKDALKAGLSKINNIPNSDNNNNNNNNNNSNDNDNFVNDDEQCVIKLIAPPDYNISIDTFDSDEALQRLNKVIKTITNEIQKYGGSLKIKEDPHVINLEGAENVTQEEE